jgi:dienelactone hydrolase
MIRVAFIIGLLLLGQAVCFAAEFPDPADLPEREGLPDLFTFRDGSKVKTAEDWQRRREELKALALHYGYGELPPTPEKMLVSDAESKEAFDRLATLHTFTLYPSDKPDFKIHCGLWVPTGTNSPWPVIVAIDPVWHDHVHETALKLIRRGYAFAGMVYFDIDDDKGTRTGGIYDAYPDFDGGTLAAWAWAASRLTDYLVTLDDIDAEKIAITGHSRTGKAALLAGALDERFTLVAPHSSGTGGAGALRIDGEGAETMAMITQKDRFHYWFHPRLREFVGQKDRLPFDTHFLKALVAPRGLLSLEAEDDKWANIPGTKATHKAAEKVFAWLGVLENQELWYRPGGHDMVPADWGKMLLFADWLWREEE